MTFLKWCQIEWTMSLFSASSTTACATYTKAASTGVEGLDHRSFSSVIDVPPGSQVPSSTDLFLILILRASLHARLDDLWCRLQVPANSVHASKRDGSIESQVA